MANANEPTGFKLVNSFAGAESVGTIEIYVDSSNATAIFKGDAISIEADGNAKRSASADGGIVAGIAVAISTIDSFGNRKPALYLPATTAGYIQYVPAAPGMTFEIQADDMVAQTAIGATADFALGSGGSTLTGISSYQLDASDVGTGQQLRILGKVNKPGNDWGQYVKILVCFVESIFQNNTTI